MRVISLGWGVQSWTLAAMAALGDLPKVDYAIHADTTHEMAGTYSHAAKWGPWLVEHGVQVVTVLASRSDVVREDWGDTGAVLIPAFSTMHSDGKRGQIRRQCTHDWKISPIRRFIRSKLAKPTPGAVQSLQGISLDEFHRMRDSDVAYILNVYPLVEMRMTRTDCEEWLRAHDLEVPPKSACTLCPYHSLAAWKALKRAGGADWESAIEVDRLIRKKRPLVDLFLHPARRPLPEAVSIPEDQGAHQIKMDLTPPCDSGHCFT